MVRRIGTRITLLSNKWVQCSTTVCVWVYVLSLGVQMVFGAWIKISRLFTLVFRKETAEPIGGNHKKYVFLTRSFSVKFKGGEV